MITLGNIINNNNNISMEQIAGYCPCPDPLQQRYLQQDNNSTTSPTTITTDDSSASSSSSSSSDGETWEIVYTCVVLLIMFVALVSDRIGADSVMLAALTAFMAAEIISVQEGLTGFANQGLLTVLVLFVVAEGISKTGALDWYMQKLLGKPSTVASAQLRLMIPIAVVSAFLNNTPVVAVMIPIVQRWAKNNRMSSQQLLVPLSFASILGGTCTLIGTSTNLVVVGLLNERYGNDDDDDDSVSIGLFDLGEYGVPVAMAGIAYVLLLSPWLLPGGSHTKKAAGVDTLQDQDDILLGARLTQWSPAAGRTVQRSGLRDTGGIFLVSVHRAATGNVHRAVSRDFVLNVGDILYFTGLVENFGEFCEEHGLEVVTNEVEATIREEEAHAETPTNVSTENGAIVTPVSSSEPSDSDIVRRPYERGSLALEPVREDSESRDVPIQQVGVTKESLLQADEEERLRHIHRMSDLIRGNEPSEQATGMTSPTTRRRPELRADDPAKIVVTIDHHLVVVGISAKDRAGLLLDISKALLRLKLELRHTEAAVRDDRSISIWRCEVMGTDLPDPEEIWTVLNALLSSERGIEAIKKRGLRVIRAKVTRDSRLVGKTATEVDFRKSYKAAIVAVKNGRGGSSLSSVRFSAGDVLVLQASDDSPLLVAPPVDFYKNLADSKDDKTQSRSSSVSSFRNVFGRLSRKSSSNLEEADTLTPAVVTDAKSGESGNEGFFIPSGEESSEDEIGIDVESGTLDMGDVAELEREGMESVWRDLQVICTQGTDCDGGGAARREFLTAMAVATSSKLAGQTAAQIGIDRLPDLFLVSIDRPVHKKEAGEPKRIVQGIHHLNEALCTGDTSDAAGSIRTDNPVFTAITKDEPLNEGDVLWFAGPASAVGDLRKIPGLVSYESEEVEKINEKVFDRRLVQAVVARKGELVGKTVKDLRFRSRYGAAVIAVHREGKRVHEHPGKVKLNAGDVLLLEAGPSFIAKSAENDRSFALLAEVEDSAPPRLSLLIPALLVTAAMLIVYTAGLTSLLVSALVAAIIMVIVGILSEQEARTAVNWEVYITIASAFGIGTALVNSGVADAIANFLVDVGTAVGMGDAGLFGAVYFATFLISNVVTNNAAAALLFPIAMNAAEKTGTDRVLMSYALMLGASASFMSPFGYTTNLLIYGPGGYKYNDFLIFGTPMQIVLWVLSTAYLSVIRPWYLSWLGTGACLVLIIAFRVCNVSLKFFQRKPQVQLQQ